MSGIFQTINTFFESQSGMFWLCGTLFFALVYAVIARIVEAKKTNEMRDKYEKERRLKEMYSNLRDLANSRCLEQRLGNAKLAKIAGDAQQEIENLKDRNKRLYGANEFLADMVMDKSEFVAAINVAADRACSTCQTKTCDICEIRAMRGLYLEANSVEPDRIFTNAAEGLPHRSCVLCVHATECREDGGEQYDMPPQDDEKQDVDCFNFEFDEKSASQDEAPDALTACESNCSTCIQNETCDKTAGSGYLPDENGGCGNWENAFPTKIEAALESAANADHAVDDDDEDWEDEAT